MRRPRLLPALVAVAGAALLAGCGTGGELRSAGRVPAAVGPVRLWPTLPPASAAPKCTDIEVIFARGTDEPAGIGVVGQALVALGREEAERNSETDDENCRDGDERGGSPGGKKFGTVRDDVEDMAVWNCSQSIGMQRRRRGKSRLRTEGYSDRSLWWRSWNSLYLRVTFHVVRNIAAHGDCF